MEPTFGQIYRLTLKVVGSLLIIAGSIAIPIGVVYWFITWND